MRAIDSLETEEEPLKSMRSRCRRHSHNGATLWEWWGRELWPLQILACRYPSRDGMVLFFPCLPHPKSAFLSFLCMAFFNLNPNNTFKHINQTLKADDLSPTPQAYRKRNHVPRLLSRPQHSPFGLSLQSNRQIPRPHPLHRIRLWPPRSSPPLPTLQPPHNRPRSPSQLKPISPRLTPLRSLRVTIPLPTGSRGEGLDVCVSETGWAC